MLRTDGSALAGNVGQCFAVSLINAPCEDQRPDCYPYIRAQVGTVGRGLMGKVLVLHDYSWPLAECSSMNMFTTFLHHSDFAPC